MSQFRDEDIQKVFARKVSRDELEQAVNRSDELISKVEGGFIRKEIAKVRLLSMMLKDYWNGNYTEMPWHTIAAGVITALYILSPIDLVPDFIPVAGQIDDLAVLMFFWKMAGEDIKEYALWKIENGNKEVAELYERAFTS
ncbi:MAG: YkvA family protein [Aquificaceae bacterium]|nr:YkvA family protein [Aquificaceae bacterium]MDW8433383.1 YkvA family protein [Aquificaceae bacterium]